MICKFRNIKIISAMDHKSDMFNNKEYQQKRKILRPEWWTGFDWLHLDWFEK